MTNETLDLIKELDVEFGKEAQKRKAREQSDKPPKDWNELSEAKRLAFLAQATKTWRPIAVSAIRVFQSCQCCGNTQAYIATYFVRFQHRTKATIWDYRVPIEADHSALPRIIEDQYETVPECPSCFASNSLQAANGHKLECACEINMNQTSTWTAVNKLVRQPELFKEESENAEYRETPETTGADASRTSYDARNPIPPEFAVARSFKWEADVRTKEPDSGAGFSGVLE